jgi:hypothetical protein
VNRDERKKVIAQRATERRQRMAQGYATYWLTRDTLDGGLTSYVEVWLVRPNREQEGDRVIWSRPEELAPEVQALYSRWTLDEAYAEVRGGVPSNDRECLRVGPEPTTAAEQRSP